MKKVLEEKNNLGLYWDSHMLCFVETVGVRSKKMFSVAYQPGSPRMIKDNKLITENMQITTAIQDAFSQNNISTSTLNLSLPIKEIIFRSFVIPWMRSHEVKSVVSFEVLKYIPFSWMNCPMRIMP